ncbi:carbon-nitrogen hydrolase family protein [Thiobaca trueperi]|uniref:Putative amidohydrolase n=1 Tax=Thiobaca trueperi TaxID=127458 RepID=A0A4R3N072_9GAMM|nr:carbon-nitrogen hydrolase family protein [Thiobaca trueperi]TCT22145.1 putative amidohydrolase [Thiobaca trueperi]
MRIKIAACQYPIDSLPDLTAWRNKVSALVAEAATAGASLLVFPEYASLELASLLPEAVRSDLRATLAGMQPFLPEYLALHRELAERHQVYLLAGSFPVANDGVYRNRVWLFGSDGRCGWQDKLIMTRFEREQWGIAGGEGLTLFETAIGRLGILICYDAEFPLLARALVAAGADLLLVPSCTDGWPGYHRVRIACQARALEGQCYVVQSPTVGEASWSPAVDVNRGLAGVFSPPDHGLPDDGVIALGRAGETGWALTELDLDRLRAVQTGGQVLNRRDWGEQRPVVVREIDRVVL